MKVHLRIFIFVLAAVLAVWVGGYAAGLSSEKAAVERQQLEEKELSAFQEILNQGGSLSEWEKVRFEELMARYDRPHVPSNPIDNQGGPDGFGYRFVDNQGGDTATYNWIELSGDPQATWTTWTGSHDDAVQVIALGMTFPFYGSTYTNATVSTNGNFQFTTSSTSYSNACLPTTVFTGPVVFPFWDDLHLDYGGQGNSGSNVIAFRNFGDYVVIEYDSIGHCCSVGTSHKFEAILYADGKIKFQYNNLVFGTNANSQTIGIQAGSTGPALQYVCNAVGIQPVNQLAIWFAPSATGSISGTVTDENAAPVPNARVRITQTGATAYTDAQGNYTFPMVAVGTYSMTATRHGYDPDSENNVVVTDGQNTDVDFQLTSQGLVIFTSNDVPQTISPTGTPTVTSTLTIDEAASIEDLDVMVNITHTYVGDLRISLTSPDQITVVLFNRQGLGGDNFNSTIFDDEGDSTIAQGTPPYEGSYIPVGSLGMFDSNNMLGEWTLTIEDLAAGNGGTLNAWEIYVQPGAATGGSITGTVTSADTGDPLPNMQVEIVETQATRVTSASGQYTFGLVPAGTYSLHFSGGLYEPLTIPNVVVTEGQTTTVNAQMQSSFLIYTYTGQPVPITDNDSSFAVINVPDDFEATGAQVLVSSITHTWDSDIDMYIRAPNGTQVELSTDNGSSSDNYVNTLFDDAAECLISNTACATAPFTGTFRPEGQLSAFANTPALGDWTLIVYDDLGGDEGFINGWQLILGGSIGPEGTLAGTVRQFPSNNALQGAWIVAVGTDSVQSNAQGQYTLDLPVGTYTVRFSHANYCDSVRTNIDITEDQTTTLNVAMRSPNAVVSVSSIQHEGVAGQVTTSTFTIQNTGSCVLAYSMTDNQPWLSEAPAQGNVQAGQTSEITVTFDATNLSIGDYNGQITITHSATGSPVAIPVDLHIPNAADDQASLPTEFALLGNYPNPFNAVTEIRYDLPQAAFVTITLYNVLGQDVRALKNGMMEAGHHVAVWDGRDDRGLNLTSGLYLMRLDAAGHSFVGKVMLLK